jgi:hypothetical protein
MDATELRKTHGHLIRAANALCDAQDVAARGGATNELLSLIELAKNPLSDAHRLADSEACTAEKAQDESGNGQ